MQITICGGGNAAHTLAGLLAACPGTVVNLYLPFEDEADRWRQGIALQGGIAVEMRGVTRLGCPEQISNDPARVVPGSELAILALPAYAHEEILNQISPYLEDSAWVGAFPARGGLDLCFRAVLGEKSRSSVLFGLQTLPWACRVTRFGQAVSVLGVKEQVDLAAWPSTRAGEVIETLQKLLNLRLQPVESFLALTLADTGQLIHPGIMYGLFHDWDGSSYPEAPLFYQGVGAYTSELLEQMSAEVQELRLTLQAVYPHLDLSTVRSLRDWLVVSYREDIEDPSTLRSCFVTNRGYRGLRVPVRSTDAGLLPDFSARYLAEDVPYNLLVTRGIAELAGVAIPVIDQVITWAQERLGKSYLVGGRLVGPDLAASRAPQRYGFYRLQNMVDSLYAN